MAEAESLCSKIGILINGSFACIGDIETLKANSGGGYNITIHLNPEHLNDPSESLEVLAEKESQKVELVLREYFEGIEKLPSKASTAGDVTVMFKVPINKLVFSSFFEACEGLKKRKEIVDYSITVSSLEDLFLYYCQFQNQQNRKSIVQADKYRALRV